VDRGTNHGEPKIGSVDRRVPRTALSVMSEKLPRPRQDWADLTSILILEDWIVGLDSLLILQIVLPLGINIIGGLLVLVIRSRNRRIVIIASTAACLLLSVVTAYEATPKIVIVPNLQHAWKDRASDLCKDIGLNPVEMRGTYGERAGEVQKQSLEPGAEVFRGSQIEVYISLGSPVSNP